MPGCFYEHRPQRRRYKTWRYPGVPIPRRLQDRYRESGHLTRIA
jgi:hypothetical protein